MEPRTDKMVGAGRGAALTSETRLKGHFTDDLQFLRCGSR
jgi:hypothetical protein